MSGKQAQARVFVTPTQGREEWARIATSMLINVAREYNGVITDTDLTEQVQVRSGRWTRTPPARWLGAVLSEVTQHCYEAALPPLPALVVSRSLEPVGFHAFLSARVNPSPTWATAILASNIVDLHQQAAGARLQCYVRWCRQLPADAHPQLTAASPHRRGAVPAGRRP